jgi:DNA polymerase-1
MVMDTALPSKKLILVDAYSLLFRAFFAGRYLSTTDDRPTGALFGFSNMLFSLLNTEKPDAMVVCWDAHQKTLRAQEFAAYKAHRPEVDPQLKAQMPVARELVEAFAIQSAEVGGYEADDLIGTLATQGAREGYAVTILTGDSDQLQLVGEGVIVQMTMRGVTDVKVYDVEAVRARYGIGPERIPDWKALVGDTSDNIPGVPGIGDKTATLLLQKWETLENLLEHVAEVTPPKARAALEANIEQARLSKKLATIVCDVPVEFAIRPYAPTDDDRQRLREMFTHLEFKSLHSRIPRPIGAPLEAVEKSAPQDAFVAQRVWIRSAEELQDAIASAQRSGTVAVQVEATHTLPMQAELKGIAFAPSGEVGYYVPIRVQAGGTATSGLLEGTGAGGLFDGTDADGLGGLFGGADPDQPLLHAEYAATVGDLAPLLESAQIHKVGHNVKPAEILLERVGLHPTPFVFDTLIAAYLLNAGRSSYPLMDLAETYLDVRLDSDDAFAPQETLARETALVFALVAPQRQALEDLGMTSILNTMEMPLVPILAEIEQTGLLVDKRYLSTLADRMATDLEALAKEVYGLAGEEFAIGSTKQLQTILFEKLKLPTGKKTKTGYSTGADLLEQLAGEHVIARKIMEWREVAKLKSTYADALGRLINPTTGRIHTSLNQTVASTGRLSSSDPNLQNIPIRSHAGREIRRAFIAPKGRCLLSCDYSQIELRILAHVTGDPALTQAFQSNADVHATTAATVFGVPLEEVTPDQRRQAKTINFAVIYGQSGFALAATLGVDTSTANQWIKDYFDRLPGVKRYVEETTAQAHRQGYVSTLLGRRRYVPELQSGNHNMRQFAERAAVNMPIQGTAADIMKLAMIAVVDWLHTEQRDDIRLLLQVHDELLFEVKETEIARLTPLIVRRMEAAYPLDVPLRTDAKAGANWAEMQSVS